MAAKTEPKCRRCHGTGVEPVKYSARALRVLDKLTTLGRDRASRAPSLRMSGRQNPQARAELDKLYGSIRKEIERGTQLGIRTPDMMAALGVTSPAYYKIKNGQTGA